ncbi:MAG: DUF5678 domain-containing protein [Candidatus Aenigmatarchaeota archaeon]
MECQKQLQLIEKMDKNDELVRKNYEELQKKYKNEFIAIKNGKVIDHDTEIEKLRDRLKTKEKDLTTILVYFIPEKNTVILY